MLWTCRVGHGSLQKRSRQAWCRDWNGTSTAFSCLLVMRRFPTWPTKYISCCSNSVQRAPITVRVWSWWHQLNIWRNSLPKINIQELNDEKLYQEVQDILNNLFKILNLFNRLVSSFLNYRVFRWIRQHLIIWKTPQKKGSSYRPHTKTITLKFYSK